MDLNKINLPEGKIKKLRKEAFISVITGFICIMTPLGYTIYNAYNGNTAMAIIHALFTLMIFIYCLFKLLDMRISVIQDIVTEWYFEDDENESKKEN